jgi:cobalt-zinc-cadmium efflux system outer membrane protein
MRALPIILLTSSALALAACISPTADITRPEPRPLGREFIPPPPPGAETGAPNGPVPGAMPSAFQDAPQPAGAASLLPVVAEPAGVLTLPQALALSLMGSPDFAAYAFDTRAAEARTLQAGYRPNPELGLESEDFGGNRGRNGFRESQTTLALSQVVELGAKRASRLRVARLEESLAAWDYEAKRLDVFVDVTRAFAGVLAAQRKLELATATLGIERQFAGSVTDRVRAGKVSPIEQRRADVSLANGRIVIDRAKRELTIARDELAALWDGGAARFQRAEGDLNNVTPPPPIDSLIALSAQNPDLARWTTEIQQREARVSLERSKQIPDITLRGGVRRYGDGGSAFVAGIGIPLPVFGMNEGNVTDAEMQLNKSLAQRRAVEVRTAVAVRRSFEQLASAYDEVVTLRRDVLPAAEAAFNGTSEGYRDGKFGLLEVLDARRAQTDARSRLVDALATYQGALADAERLTGQSLRRTGQQALRAGEKS